MTNLLPILICIGTLAGAALLDISPKEKAWLLAQTTLAFGVVYWHGRDHGGGDR